MDEKKGFGLAPIKRQEGFFQVDSGYIPQPGEQEELHEERREIYISKTMLREMVENAKRRATKENTDFIEAFWQEMEP